VPAKKKFAKFSIILGIMFVAFGLLVYPIWSDLHAYFGGNLPVLQISIIGGGVFIGYCYYLRKSTALDGERVSIHLMVMGVVNALMLGLMILLVWNLGLGIVLLFRTLTQNLAAIFWAGAVIFVIWYWPRWRPLARRTKIIMIIVLALLALIGISLPWQVNFTALPVIFMQQNGVTSAWGTNMYTTHEIQYGSTPEMVQSERPQSHGLQVTNDGFATAYLPDQPEGRDLYLKVFVDGIRLIRRSSTVKGGKAETPTIQVTFPPEDDDLFLAAFSDIHEINIAYELIAKHIPWERVDYALYLGDFVIDVGEPSDLVRNLLNLSTGGRDLPRVFARGNHETRGTGAWALSDVFLPASGSWYYTFSHGDTFFVVLDSGEDKPDTHVEYAGLVDFTAYHREQAEWLNEVFASVAYQEAATRIVLVHIPPFETSYMSPSFLPVVELLKNQADINLVMSGHTHRGGIWMPDETGWPYPITTNGGPLLVDTKAVTAYLTDDGIQLDLINILGDTVESEWIPAK